MRNVKFRLDCLPDHVFDGFTDDQSWNGFACPWFTRQEGLRLHAALVELRDTEYLDAGEIDVEWHPENFYHTVVDGVLLYGIGSHEWTWEEVTE